MFKTRQLLSFGVMVGMALVGFGASANSLTFTWDANSVAYDGTATPTAAPGNPYYLQAVFEDYGAPGSNQVKVTITANFAGTTKVDDISFNVTPDEFATTIAAKDLVNVAGFTHSLNSQGAGSVLTFDMSFDTGNGQSVLMGQEVASAILYLTSPPSLPGQTLNALSFDALTPGNNKNLNKPIEIYAGAHFQAIGANNKSSWIASGTPTTPEGTGLPGTPLPSAAMAGGALFSVLALTKRRRTSKAA